MGKGIELRVIVVEDNDANMDRILGVLREIKLNCDHVRVENLQAFLQAFRSGQWDLVIVDYQISKISEAASLAAVRQAMGETPLIFISGPVGEETAVNAVLWGARDFIMKDNLQRLGNAIERVVGDVQQWERSRLAERHARLSERLETVGRLAGGIAHDFNNLLTAINGYVELIISRVGNSAPIFDDLLEIRKAGEKAAKITRELLAFSRRQILQPQTQNIHSIILNLEKEFGRIVGETNQVRLALRAKEAFVRVDSGQIELALVKLVTNAHESMPDGGWLCIETESVYLDGDYVANHISVTPGEYVQISVSDTGRGIPESILPNIFEPFFTTKKKGEGTGLGLANVYGIVKQSGGNIWVYSVAGKGTTFKIYLPRVGEVVEKPIEPRKAVHSSQGNETILVVEDEDLVRRLVCHILRDFGYHVLEARGFSEAMAINRSYQKPLHMILTDVVMPEMGGKEIVDAILKERPHLRVLFMSGYTGEAIVNHGILNPGTPFIQKPFAPDALRLKVCEVLNGGPLLKQ